MYCLLYEIDEIYIIIEGNTYLVILLSEIEGNTYNDRRKYIFFQSYKIEGFPFKIEGKTYLLFAFYSI